MIRLIAIFCIIPCFVYAQNPYSLKKPDTDSIAQAIADSIIKTANYQIVIADTSFSDSEINFAAAGDIMLGTSFPKGYLPPNNNSWPLILPVKRHICDADVSFANLEGCLLNQGPVVKRCKDTTKCYAFRMPESYVHSVKKAGFTMVSLANNHINDFGEKGQISTMSALDAVNIEHAGLLKKPYSIFTKNNITYGFCAFSPNRGTVRMNDTIAVAKLVKSVADSVDILIVSFHGGAEGAKHQHITRKTEEFYGENRGNVYRFARMVIDNGADVVIGHGPHVLRAIDLYKDKFIAYSLGNFCTYARFNLSGPNGLAALLQLKLRPNGSFISGNIVSFKQLGEGGLTYDKHNNAAKKIQSLTKTDIPEAPLKIEETKILRVPAN